MAICVYEMKIISNELIVIFIYSSGELFAYLISIYKNNNARVIVRKGTEWHSNKKISKFQALSAIIWWQGDFVESDKVKWDL